jgi:bifunctional N-acetylglucosamine-1-phosphate-uridyltransferase/glucosamine-1-phosphate-acetyltransferase GlmU-like protein
MLALDRAHNAEIRDLESKRLDAIRGVDVAAVQRAAEVQAQAAITLQGQVAGTAEAMRTQLAALTQSFTDGLANAIKPLADALAVVQQQQNMQAGQRVQVAESRDVRGSGNLTIGNLLSALALLAVLAIAFFR